MFAKVFFTPAQRVSSATEPCAWITQSGLTAAGLGSLVPTVWPASVSSEPKYIFVPACW